MTTCTLKGRPATIHLVRGPVVIVDGAVTTWCGLRGFARLPGPDAWRTCQKCRKAVEEAGE